jgi:2-methylcitrate dehydratase PrpD
MSGHDIRSANRPDPDKVLVDIADYVCNYKVSSDLAFETAHYCLMDTLACGFQALDYPACTKLLGRSCREQRCRAAHAFPVLRTNWTRCLVHSTSAR